MTKAEDERKNKNADLIARMKNGESLALYDATATWFQPRGLIKKDGKEVDRIFKKADDGDGK